jgi:hypothetical protein
MRGLKGAEAILILRAVIGNGTVGDYRCYHLAREHQRRSPGAAQGQHMIAPNLTLTQGELHPSSMCGPDHFRSNAWRFAIALV